MVEPTYILVHGAWHGAWCWRDVGAMFDERGITWRAIDLPSSHDDGEGSNDLEVDCTALVEMASSVGPVVLVGHSYGGAVISDAASRIPALEKLVYVAALIPRLDESSTDASRVVRIRTALDEAMVVDGPYVGLEPALVVDALYHRSSSSTQAWAAGRVGRQTLASFRSPRRSPDPKVVRRYVLCRDDRAIDPSVQAIMAGRCDEVLAIDSDHSPFLSCPDVCVDAILRTDN